MHWVHIDPTSCRLPWRDRFNFIDFPGCRDSFLAGPDIFTGIRDILASQFLLILIVAPFIVEMKACN